MCTALAIPAASALLTGARPENGVAPTRSPAMTTPAGMSRRQAGQPGQSRRRRRTCASLVLEQPHRRQDERRRRRMPEQRIVVQRLQQRWRPAASASRLPPAGARMYAHWFRSTNAAERSNACVSRTRFAHAVPRMRAATTPAAAVTREHAGRKRGQYAPAGDESRHRKERASRAHDDVFRIGVADDRVGAEDHEEEQHELIVALEAPGPPRRAATPREDADQRGRRRRTRSA